MAIVEWKGTAMPVAQVTTVTVAGTVLAGELWSVTVGQKTVSTTGHTAVGDVADALVELLGGTEPELAEMDWEADAGVITGTAATAGIPVVVSCTTDSASGTITAAEVTAATGPNFVDNVENWSGGALPVDSDDIIFGTADEGPKYALDAIDDVTPALLRITPQCDYDIGLPQSNPSGYREYRDRYLELLGATNVVIESESRGIVRLNFGSAQFSAQVISTGNSTESGIPAVCFLGTHANNSIEQNDGDVGVAAYPGESSTIKTVRLTGGTLTCGSGVTLDGTGSTLTLTGGTLTIASDALTVSVFSGLVISREDAEIDSITIQSGTTWELSSSGVVATAVVNGTLDLTKDASEKEITDLTLGPTATVRGFERLTVTTLSIAPEVKTISVS
jgi:hypothetical protein